LGNIKKEACKDGHILWFLKMESVGSQLHLSEHIKQC
jgi:hypothetical protein